MATSKIQKQYVTRNLSGSGTIDGNGGTGVVTGDLTLAGYTPIGILRIQKSGTNSGNCTIARYNFNDTTWTVGYYNHGSSTATCNVTVTILYERA